MLMGQGSMSKRKKCVNCNRPMIEKKGVLLCPHCDSGGVDISRIFMDGRESEEHVFIECPGATLYSPNSNEVVTGVKWHDDNDPLQGYEIIDHPVYAPEHVKRRRIKKEALGKIRRCRACQDYTVRMRRKEGADFFIPSPRHPGRKKLKSVTYSSTQPR